MADPPRRKVVLLGNSGVGKTALVERARDDIFQGIHVPTVGAQFISLELMRDAEKYILELWDTAGQEVFRSLVGFYARDAQGAFILFDVTERPSFEELPKWIEFIRENSPRAALILFANKIDLTEQRAVSREEAETFAANNGVTFFEGSAKTGENVNDTFEKMLELVTVGVKAGRDALVLEGGEVGQKKGCC
jgi:small GTP-binding protein